MISRIKQCESYIRLFFISAVGLLFLSTACLSAEFTADITAKSGSVNGKLLVKGKKVRQDLHVDKYLRVIIARGDLGVSWVLDPSRKVYTQAPNVISAMPDDKELKKYADIKSSSKEKVCGYICKKTVYVPRDKPKSRITVWYAEKIKYPIKVELKYDGGTETIALKNIKEMKIKDSLFEVPKDYKKAKS